LFESGAHCSQPGRAFRMTASRLVRFEARIARHQEHYRNVPLSIATLAVVKAQAKAHSYRFRDGVVRVSAWHGRPDIASAAFFAAGAPSPRTIDRVVTRLRDAGYREVLTNALGTAAEAALVDRGFVVRDRLLLLEHRLVPVPPASGQTRKATRADRDAIVAVDDAAFESFWRFDDLALREAARATPKSSIFVVDGDAEVAGFVLVGRAGGTGYVQRLAVAPAAQRRGYGRALVADGLRWLREHGAARALVNTQADNSHALALYRAMGFADLESGLSVLGRAL
jgi:ribosomal protein S18 acetylase RimI-like enzyme